MTSRKCTSSDASDMLSDFEDSGHISMDTVRESIQQMLVIARSQEDSDDEPEWMDETRDYLTHGQFIDGKYHISALVSSELATPPFKQMVMGIYPMLTAEECDQFSEQSKAGMQVVDIVDGFNIKRMRDEAEIEKHRSKAAELRKPGGGGKLPPGASAPGTCGGGRA